MKSSIVILFMVLFCVVLFAQAPDTMWTKTFGGNDQDWGYSVQQTIDGGFIITGYTDSFGAGGRDVWLIKTDANGDTLWTKTFGGGGGSDSDWGSSVQQTSDGGFIIAGSTNSFGAGYFDVWLIKTDENGDTLWTKTFGGGNDDYGESVQQTTDGGYIITGGTESFGTNWYDTWLIKTDANGDTLWTRTFGGNSNDWGSFVQQTFDGGYIIAGSTWSFGVGYTDIWLIKTNSNGDTLWTKTFGDSRRDYASSVQQTTDGGYIVVGSTDKDNPNPHSPDYTFPWIIKTDSNGDTLWTKIFHEEGYAGSGQQTSDNGYIVPVYTGWLIKTDANGNTLWTKTFDDDGLQSSVQTTDGGYVITGQTTLSGGFPDVWLIKVAPDVTSIDENLHAFISGYQLQQNFPNPFNPATTINYQLVTSSEVELTIYNLLGQQIQKLVNTQQPAGAHQVQWDGRDESGKSLTSGIYFYKLEAGNNFTETKKMVLMR